MCISEKYDWGATLSDINISRLPEQPQQLAAFEKTRGLYARVETGDALFIPKRTWHAVVALEPSISLGVFGLTGAGNPARWRPQLGQEPVAQTPSLPLGQLHLPTQR